MSTEKYKELYRLSNELLQEEHQRFTRMENKAERYLTVLTFLL